jgi:hypothetical protein
MRQLQSFLLVKNKPPNEDSMKILSALLVVLFALVCSHASAKSSNYVFTGKDIYESCTHALKGLDKTGEYDDHRFGACAGYIAGIVDFHTVVSTVESLPVDMFCLPRNISTAQVIRDVTQYLEDNPGKHHDLAAYLVILALREAYPCQEEAFSK